MRSWCAIGTDDRSETLKLPTPLRARPASDRDIPALTTMLDACTTAFQSRSTSTAETTARLGTPGCVLSTDSLLVLDGDSVVGFAQVWPDPPTEARGFARVHPAHGGRTVGTHLVAWMSGRARGLAGSPRALTTTTWARDSGASAVLGAAGAQPTRHFFRMTRPLDAADVGAPDVIDSDIALRAYRPGADDHVLFAAFTDSFADHWGTATPDPHSWWWDERDSPHSGYDPSLWTIAEAQGEVAGFLLARVREREGVREGYVSQLGVRRPWRGRGVARAMLHGCFGRLAERGIARVALDVDTENTTSALALYRGVGMAAEPAFTVWTLDLHGRT